ADHRVGPRLHGQHVGHELEVTLAVRADLDVAEVAVVPRLVHGARVGVSGRVEVRAGRGRVRSRAVPLLVDVEPVGAGRRVLDPDLDLRPRGDLGEYRFPRDLRAALRLDRGRRPCARGRLRGCGEPAGPRHD